MTVGLSLGRDYEDPLLKFKLSHLRRKEEGGFTIPLITCQGEKGFSVRTP
jgi:hypothetical protein